MATIVVAALVSTGGAVAGAAAPKFDPERSVNTTSVVFSVTDPGIDASTLAAYLDNTFGPDIATTMALDRTNVIAAEVTTKGRAILESLDSVDAVSNARSFRLSLDQSVPWIGAAVLHQAGLTGAGKVVAVIDSGIASNHPSLVGSVVYEACFTNGAETATLTGVTGFATPRQLCPDGSLTQINVPGAGEPCTLVPADCSHGTGVAGVITSADPTFTGVAPDAGIISLRVTAVVQNPNTLVDETYIPEQGVLNALDHVLYLSQLYDIAAVNLSLGGPCPVDPVTGEVLKNLLWEPVVAKLSAVGIAVVAASGNDGSTTSISFPACLPGVVSVGATDRTGNVTAFSDSNELLDLVAPGQSIRTTVPIAFSASGTALESGTSFSAPHVAASFALLDSTFPDFGVDRMRNLLRSTAAMAPRPTPDPLDRETRFPEIRVAAAAAFVPFADVTGTAFWVGPADWAKATGISTGVDGINFGPTGTLSRGQAVTFLWRFMGQPAASAPATFSDVISEKFYGSAVDWAASSRVTTGIGDNLFDPDGGVTRGQLATFMWRMAGEPAVLDSAGFTDVAPGIYYAAAVDWMAATGITTGIGDGLFDPEGIVNRLQLVTFLHRLASTAGAWTGSVAPPALALF